MPGGPHPPISVIASWPPPSANPQTRGWGMPITIIVLYVVAAIVVVARLWARLVIQRNAGVDDACIVIGMIPLFGLAFCFIGAFRWWGFDRHVWDLTPAETTSSRKLVIAIETLYLISMMLTKVSILLFYRRMSNGAVSRGFWWLVQSSIAFVILTTIGFLIALYIACRPFKAFWLQVDFLWAASHTEGKDYKCFSEPADLMTASAVNMLQDFITFLMPMILFWKLQIPFRQKVLLGCLFGVGFITLIASIMRMYLTYVIFYVTYDITWATGPAWVWAAVETHLAVICASAPALKPFFQKYLGSVTTFASSVSSQISSFRKRRAVRKGYDLSQSDATRTGNTGTNFSKQTATGDFKSTKMTDSTFDPDAYDLELGGISVTREVEVASAYGDTADYPLSNNHLVPMRDRTPSSGSDLPLQRP